ncbi:MAG TPA: chemotaxis protein CheB [Gammaproteobacteria bacterium]|nr:chemotaxis protein CheB [Gammaproteobacteria bacterium]
MAQSRKARADLATIEAEEAPRRDTVVVGASAGGVAPLRTLLAQLPRNFGGSVFVVQHLAPHAASYLADALQAATPLSVQFVENAQRIAPGRVYVAPPDRHLIVVDDTVHLATGPRENRMRPSINPLFLTAAATRNSRTVAVLLSGTLDDGIAGLVAVKRCGGIVIVQDPAEARFGDMPRKALESVEVDHVLRVEQMGALLLSLSREYAPLVVVPRDLIIEGQLATGSWIGAVETIGECQPVACPECGGTLWKVGNNDTAVYRCGVGHAWSTSALLDQQSEEIERALWVAVRLLDERALVLQSIANHAERRGRPSDREHTAAAEASEQAQAVRRVLAGLRARQAAVPAAPRGTEPTASRSAVKG